MADSAQTVVNHLKELPLQTLIAVGFTPVTAQQKLDELNIAMNAAIIDDVLAALTPAEAEKLKNDLNSGPVNADTVTTKLKNACLNSVNKPDVDKVADSTRIRIISNFWKEIDKNLTSDQRNKAIITMTANLKSIKITNEVKR